MRHYTLIDHLINGVDTALRTICIPETRSSTRATPGHNLEDISICEEDRRKIAGLMRVNHAGEVCAQALYQGQATTAKLENVRQQMIISANEEIDHLAWCEERLSELDSHVSILNPLWYAGSFVLGAVAGLAGDSLSLGFVVETEKQVVAHIQEHLKKIPSEDLKTKAILQQMEEDEARHADVASNAGARDLPFVIRKLMHGVSKLLTFSSYYI
jgi:3-demethoxyubiquinol 3-hydroxylase